MTRSVVTALLILASIPFPIQAQHPFVLTDGTPVRVRLNRNLSSADAKVGDPVDFDVVEDITVNGAVIIQQGSRVLGTVTDAAQARTGKAGKLTVNVDHARSVVGDKIALRAVKERAGGEGSGNTSVVGVAASIVTAPLMLFVKGKEITIPKGTEVTAYVHGDVRLDEARLRKPAPDAATKGESGAAKPSVEAAAPKIGTAPQSDPAMQTAPSPAAPSPPPATAAPPPPPRPSGMTNADVLALREAGFSDDLIIAKIKASRCAFRMETSDMLELKKAGLSDRVISAMMDKSQ